MLRNLLQTLPKLTVEIDCGHSAKGFVVAHTLVEGKAVGGTRIAPGLSQEDVIRLARGMTFKYAISGGVMGGSKSGICLPAKVTDRERNEILDNFGEGAAPLLHGGVYMGCDLGCTYDDRDRFHRAAGFEVKVPDGFPYSWPELWKHYGPVTGRGVYAAFEVVHQNFDLSKNCEIAIQGFGNVGQAFALKAFYDGHKVVALADRLGSVYCKEGFNIPELVKHASTDGIIDRAQLDQSVGVFNGDTQKIIYAPCDALVLAARGDQINAYNADKIQAKSIIEGANNPVSRDARDFFLSQGRGLAPDVVANCGAALGTALIFNNKFEPGMTQQEALNWGFSAVDHTIKRNMGFFIEQYKREARPSQEVLLDLGDRNLYEKQASLKTAA